MRLAELKFLLFNLAVKEFEGILRLPPRNGSPIWCVLKWRYSQQMILYLNRTIAWSVFLSLILCHIRILRQHVFKGHVFLAI